MPTTQAFATMIRNIISERSPASTNVTIPHIIAAIPLGLELWAREAQKDSEKSEYLEKNISDNLDGSDATFDLTPYIDGTLNKISLKNLRAQTVYVMIDGEKTACTWVSSYNQYKYGRYPTDAPTIFLDSPILYTKDSTGSTTGLASAVISFTATDIPSDATQIPDALVGDAAAFIASFVIRELTVDGPARRR